MTCSQTVLRVSVRLGAIRMKKKKIYPHEFEDLTRLIQTFEDGFLKFLSLGPTSKLHINSWCWEPLKDNHGYEVSCGHFDEMAEELNKAIDPIREKYLKILKNDMIEMAANYAAFLKSE